MERLSRSRKGQPFDRAFRPSESPAGATDATCAKQWDFLMKHLLPITLFVSVAAACAPLAYAASSGNQPASSTSSPPAAARAAAEVGLYTWTNNFIKDNVQPDGDFVLDVQTLQELESVRIGRGFAMKLVDPDQLMAGGRLSEAIHANGEWRFVVMAGESPVGLVDVRRVAGKYKMVGLGGKGLAKDVEAALAAYPGRDASLVRSYQARTDYMEIPANSATQARYAPLKAARVSHASGPDARGFAMRNRSLETSSLIGEDALATELRDAISHDARTEER